MRKELHEKELAWRTVGKNRGGNAEDFEKTEAGWNGMVGRSSQGKSARISLFG